MRALWAVVFMISVLAAAVAQTEWKRFTYSDGNFSVLFPGTPQQQASGDRNRRVFSAAIGAESYRVTCADVPAGTAWEKAVNSERDAVVSGALGVVVREEHTSIEGYPGKWVRFVGRDVIGELAIYLVRQRVYVLQAIAPKDEPRPTAFSKFLNSFRLLSKPKP